MIGVPDEQYGESVMAVVTVRGGYAAGAAFERASSTETRARLAHSASAPDSVTFVDSLPRSLASKVTKHRLVEHLAYAEPHAAGTA